MQMGLGLPVRDIIGDSSCDELRTALVCKLPRSLLSESGAGSGNLESTMIPELKYGELRALGAYPSDDRTQDFRWLWRSSIKDYDRLSQPLQKWAARMLRWTIQYRRRWAGADWDGGFKAYDALTMKLLGPVQEYPSFEEFGELCDLLRSELEAAERH